MRFVAILLLVSALAACAPPAPTTRGGIVSTNPCADQILVSLVEPDRIAAISAYSHDPAATSLPLDVARRYRATSGTAEEVIALRPDLVVTSTFTPAATRAAYERAGLKVLLLDSPTTIAASKAQIMRLADAVDRRGRGRALVSRIDAALAKTRPTPIVRPELVEGRSDGKGRASTSSARTEIAKGRVERPSTLLYIGGDLVSGAGTLLDELMTHVGLRDAAADYGLAHTGRLPLETIMTDPPDLVLTPGLETRTAALRANVLAYRARHAIFPRSLVNCGGPTIVPAVEKLAAIRRAVLR